MYGCRDVELVSWRRPVERVRVRGVSYPGPRNVWGEALQSARNLKSTPECTILKRKIQKIFPGGAP